VITGRDLRAGELAGFRLGRPQRCWAPVVCQASSGRGISTAASGHDCGRPAWTSSRSASRAPIAIAAMCVHA
jgi:hypothetical protein